MHVCWRSSLRTRRTVDSLRALSSAKTRKEAARSTELAGTEWKGMKATTHPTILHVEGAMSEKRSKKGQIAANTPCHRSHVVSLFYLSP